MKFNHHSDLDNEEAPLGVNEEGEFDWSLIRSYVDQKFFCDHLDFRVNYLKTTFTKNERGVIMYWLHCARCGESIRRISKKLAFNGQIPVLRDDKISDDWYKKRNNLTSELTKTARQWIDRKTTELREFEYNQYMRSTKWFQLRKLVLERSNYLCEGCGVRRASQVHHLTYAHFGNEFLWELRSCCSDCHERLHETTRIGRNEMDYWKYGR